MAAWSLPLSFSDVLLYVLIGLPFCLLWHGITLLTYHHLTIMWPVNNLSVRHGNGVAIARQQLSNPSI